jgi:hypothetical protein
MTSSIDVVLLIGCVPNGSGFCPKETAGAPVAVYQKAPSTDDAVVAVDRCDVALK